MQFVNIAGAAALMGIGVGSLAASTVLWKRAGFETATLARLMGSLVT